MKPILVTVQTELEISRQQLFEEILRLENWPSFKGYGPIPGVRQATFIQRSENEVGTRIRVENEDGSVHVEEIIEWQPFDSIRMRLDEFSPPLSRLASHFIETWQFETVEGKEVVKRGMALYGNSTVTKPTLWLIGRFLKNAVLNHTLALGRGDTPDLTTR